MPTFQLVVRSLPRDELPGDADVANRLVTLVREGLARGAGKPVAVVVRPRQLDLVRLDPVVGAGLPLGWFLGGLATTVTETGGAAEAVGIVGVVERRGAADAERAPMATVFLEWGDNRWWLWRALLDPRNRSIREDAVQVLSALEGDALPEGLGRWWSLARRRNVRVDMSRKPEPDATVH